MASDQEPAAPFLTRFLGVFVYSRRALELVWTTSRGLTITLAVLTLIAGVLPARNAAAMDPVEALRTE